ncbi:MAG TPA: hypothetical protein VK181_17370 [Rhizobium sp.]|nr:hypothetical protein [Rhizobium sp.]
MTSANRLLIFAIILAGVAQVLPVMEIKSTWIGSLLVTTNVLICLLGYRTGRYRLFWLVWGLATLLAFLAFGLSNPLSFVTVGLIIVLGN